MTLWKPTRLNNLRRLRKMTLKVKTIINTNKKYSGTDIAETRQFFCHFLYTTWATRNKFRTLSNISDGAFLQKGFVNGFQPIIIAKKPIIDVWQGPK